MNLTRRCAAKALAAGIPAGLAGVASARQRDVFQPNWESLQQYRCPEWFRDAKFGIWAHWGPQCVPMQGDWYARNMYIEGSAQYKYHVAHYGHPSKFGYKDIVALWKAERWDPEALVRRYQKAGARYFVALGSHCDNFDCWNSKHHRWNAVNFGPKKDIVGQWAKAARRLGLRFGVTEHMAWSYSWFNVNKGHDKNGPYAGVPYDGNDPRYEDLYFQPHAENAASYAVNPPDSWKRRWLERVSDLVDQYNPDLLYTDGGIPWGETGLQLAAHYYNGNMRRHRGKLEAVYTIKKGDPARHGEYRDGVAVLDVERGVVDGIRADAWQTDTCIGGWYYHEGISYKPAVTVIHLLVDIVSKNGNLLLNFPLRPDGTLDAEEDKVLEGITSWMAVNGEAIYGTRPWKVYGEGPNAIKGGMFSERTFKALTADDFRFTTKDGALYAFAMGRPQEEMRIKALGAASDLWPGHIAGIRLLGSDEKVEWSRQPECLRIRPLRHQPCQHAVVFRIT
jgi:alpha-L-fucosidase